MSSTLQCVLNSKRRRNNTSNRLWNNFPAKKINLARLVGHQAINAGHIFIGFTKHENLLISYRISQRVQQRIPDGERELLGHGQYYEMTIYFWRWQNYSRSSLDPRGTNSTSPNSTQDSSSAFIVNSLPLFENCNLSLHPRLIYQEYQGHGYVLAEKRKMANSSGMFLTIFDLKDVCEKRVIKSAHFSFDQGGVLSNWIRCSTNLNGFLANCSTHASFITVEPEQNNTDAKFDRKSSTFDFSSLHFKSSPRKRRHSHTNKSPVRQTTVQKNRGVKKSNSQKNYIKQAMKLEQNATLTPNASTMDTRSISPVFSENREIGQSSDLSEFEDDDIPMVRLLPSKAREPNWAPKRWEEIYKQTKNESSENIIPENNILKNSESKNSDSKNSESKNSESQSNSTSATSRNQDNMNPLGSFNHERFDFGTSRDPSTIKLPLFTAARQFKFQDTTFVGGTAVSCSTIVPFHNFAPLKSNIDTVHKTLDYEKIIFEVINHEKHTLLDYEVTLSTLPEQNLAILTFFLRLNQKFIRKSPSLPGEGNCGTFILTWCLSSNSYKLLSKLSFLKKSVVDEKLLTASKLIDEFDGSSGGIESSSMSRGYESKTDFIWMRTLLSLASESSRNFWIMANKGPEKLENTRRNKEAVLSADREHSKKFSFLHNGKAFLVDVGFQSMTKIKNLFVPVELVL